MREILFRGKSVDHNSWEYGYYFISEGRHYIQWAVKNDKMTWCQVHPESVGQFTGLLDKNGKKIFEGDLLMSNGKMFYVKYRDLYTEFFMETLDNTYSLSLGGDGPSIEIIGNIHDSPNHLPPH